MSCNCNCRQKCERDGCKSCCDCGDVISNRRSREELEAENTTLRALVSSRGCIYGHNKEGKGCELGYPGCACADDLLIFDMERSPAVGKQLVDLRAENSKLRDLLNRILGDEGPDLDAYLDGHVEAPKIQKPLPKPNDMVNLKCHCGKDSAYESGLCAECGRVNIPKEPP